ncbi:hypothetical protein OF83DRAFT_458987 [Amylostereum chailletii]|nr:hypothetical protein OF83DRAFT_458987 [Amylostereum chailletii]
MSAPRTSPAFPHPSTFGNSSCRTSSACISSSSFGPSGATCFVFSSSPVAGTSGTAEAFAPSPAPSEDPFSPSPACASTASSSPSSRDAAAASASATCAPEGGSCSPFATSGLFSALSTTGAAAAAPAGAGSPAPTALTAFTTLPSASSTLASPCAWLFTSAPSPFAKISRPGSACRISTNVSSGGAGARSSGSCASASSTTIAGRPSRSPPTVATGTMDCCGVGLMSES